MNSGRVPRQPILPEKLVPFMFLSWETLARRSVQSDHMKHGQHDRDGHRLFGRLLSSDARRRSVPFCTGTSVRLMLHLSCFFQSVSYTHLTLPTIYSV